MNAMSEAQRWHNRAAMHALEALDWYAEYFTGPFADSRSANLGKDQWIEDHIRVSLQAARYASFQAETIELEADVCVLPGVSEERSMSVRT